MKQKLFTLLTLLLCAVTSSWADTTLFSTDFSDAAWSGITSICNSSNAANEIYNGITFHSSNSTAKPFTVNQSAGTMTWCNNNMSNSYWIAIPVSGVNGSLTITVSNGTSSTRFNYVIKAETSISGSPGSGTSSSSGAPSIVTKNELSASNYVVYLGRQGSGSTAIKSITITTPSTDPVITAESTATITATESGVEATKDIDITGAYLTGSTLTATLSPAVAGLSVSLASNSITAGAISTKATLHYTATENAIGSTTLTLSDGTTSKDVTVTYKAKFTPWEWTTISESTTWDFTKTGATEIKLTDATTPTKSEEFVLANLDGINYDATFNSGALKVITEYAVRDGKFMQGNSVKFKTTVPGTVTVVFSNTGGSRPYRYALVNGTMSTEGSNAATEKHKTSQAIPVAAGEVAITGYIPDASDPTARAGDVVGPAMLRIYSITFTANDALDQESVAITCEGGIASFCSTKALDFGSSSVKAYIVTATTAESVTLTEVTKTPANTGLIIAGGTKGETVNVLVTDGATDDVTANLLKAATTAKTVADGEAFALSKTDGLFHPVQAGLTIPAGKAYMLATDIPSGAHALSLDFGGGTTGIKAVESQKVAMDNKFYNLAGQQVAAPTKGLYIVNGKKVIIK